MWRSKKFIIVALLAVVVLVGSIGGVVLAQTKSVRHYITLRAPTPSDRGKVRPIALVAVLLLYPSRKAAPRYTPRRGSLA